MPGLTRSAFEEWTTRAVVSRRLTQQSRLTGERAREAVRGTGSSSSTLAQDVGVPVVAILFCLAGLYAFRARTRTASLSLILAFGLIAAWLSLARLDRPHNLYLYLWLPILAMLVWFAVLTTALDALVDRTRSVRVTVAALAALVVALAAVALQVLDQQREDLGLSGVLLGLALTLVAGAIAYRWAHGVNVMSTVALVGTVTFIGLLAASTLSRAADERQDIAAEAQDRTERQMLSFAADVARGVPIPTARVDIRWERGEIDPQLSVAEVLAVAVARRGVDVVLPPESQGVFGPEVADPPDRRNVAIWLLDADRRVPARATRVASWNGLVAYLVPPAHR